MKNNFTRVVSIIILTTGLSIHSYGQNIYTIAGNHIAGYTGDGNQATDAELNGPGEIDLDDSDNVYISDANNSVIREVNASTSIITTIAGNGIRGYSGDGGLATDAELALPDASLDDSGNVYIADFLNDRIRKVTKSTGIITTVAGGGSSGLGDGGPATAAELNSPSGVRVDDSGNIYIADQGNGLVRKVTVATGVITSVAGDGNRTYSGDGGPATLAGIDPYDVVKDDSGNLYISDLTNYRVRKVTAKTGIITTMAGDGISGYSGDGGLATDAELGFPEDLYLDNSGNLYLADIFNNCIRKVTKSTGIITTIAGNGTAGYSGDGGPATDAELNIPCGQAVAENGDVYIGDNENNVVREIKEPCAFTLNVFPQEASICSGQGITIAASGATNYYWSPSTGLSTPTNGSVIADPTITSTYTIIGTNNGCSDTTLAIVTVIPSPNKPSFTQHNDTLISSSKHDNQWYRNDTLLQNDTSQYLIITILGQYWVTVLNEVNGCSTTSDTINIISLTGINQLTVESGQLTVYPNPFTNEVIVKINSSAIGVKEWNLQTTDVLGRTVYTKLSLNYMNDIDLSNLPGGVYFIAIINQSGRAVVPVMKE